ncbi:MAG: preprotein translocase subunit YajC [Desulfurellaceae bacterium]|nr:preprotein translocase subunit YajC [Desulfurellaceae bacterium]
MSLAFAQSGAAPEGPGPLVQFFPLILIFIVFYFLLIRPQQQKSKAHRTMLGELKRNDEVVTVGGLYGRIMEIGEKVVTLELAQNVRIRVERSKIEALAEEGGNRKTSGDKKSGKDK